MTPSRDGSPPVPGSETPLARLHAALVRVTHDINNPLAIISGNAQFLGELARGGGVDAEVAQAARDIEEASERLAALLWDLSALREEVAADARAGGLDVDQTSGAAPRAAGPGGLDPLGRTHVQLQAVRCLRDAPVERVKTELAFIEPQNAYQTLVLDYRLGWLMRHRLKATAAAEQYFERVREEARRLGTRAWEIASLLQQADLMAEDERSEDALEAYNRVYNLSRRNGLVEYIPKALLGKGAVHLAEGQRAEGEENLQKAYELARRNNLVAEQGLVLYALGRAYHRHFNFYGLALEYYEQARITLGRVPVWHSLTEALERDLHACQSDLEQLDIAKILGPVPITKLRQDYLTSLVNGFVGIPGIENRTQLGERIGLTRQAIHRNINS